MKLFTLTLSIFIVTTFAKKNCHPATEPQSPPGFSNEPCPNRPFSEYFDIQRIKGQFYPVRAYPSIYFKTMSCYIVENKLSGEFKYDHAFCEKYNGNYTCSMTVLDHINKDAMFTFDIKDQNLKGSGYYFYIDPDYRYYISYVCINLDNGQSQTSLWIDSRTPILSEKLLKEAYRNAKKYFDVNALQVIEHDENVCAPYEVYFP